MEYVIRIQRRWEGVCLSRLRTCWGWQMVWVVETYHSRWDSTADQSGVQPNLGRLAGLRLSCPSSIFTAHSQEHNQGVCLAVLIWFFGVDTLPSKEYFDHSLMPIFKYQDTVVFDRPDQVFRGWLPVRVVSSPLPRPHSK